MHGPLVSNDFYLLNDDVSLQLEVEASNLRRKKTTKPKQEQEEKSAKQFPGTSSSTSSRSCTSKTAFEGN